MKPLPTIPVIDHMILSGLPYYYNDILVHGSVLLNIRQLNIITNTMWGIIPNYYIETIYDNDFCWSISTYSKFNSNTNILNSSLKSLQ